MNIAVLCHAQYPIAPPFSGGLESLTHTTCEWLRRDGHTLHLFAHADSDSSFSITPVDNASAAAALRCTAAEIARETSRTEFEILENLRYGSALLGLRSGRFDLIQNHSLHPLPALMGAATGLPMVTTLHTPPIPYLKMSALAVREHPFHRFVAVSQNLADQWQDYVDPCEVIRNGIDVEGWIASFEKPSRAAFWFGRICREKAPHLAISAAQRGGFPLRIAGPIYDEGYFISEIEPLLGDGVEFLGHLPHSDLNTELLRASALLFTSVWEEPYGLAIAEALACGTPVAAFEVGAATELLDSSSGVLVRREDVEGLAVAFDTASELDRSACRRRAENFCGIQPMIGGYTELYRRMTGT